MADHLSNHNINCHYTHSIFAHKFPLKHKTNHYYFAQTMRLADERVFIFTTHIMKPLLRQHSENISTKTSKPQNPQEPH